MTTRITIVRILFLTLAILCLTLTHRAQASPNPIEGMLGGRVASGAPVEQMVSVGNGRICAIKPNGTLPCWLTGSRTFISEVNGITARTFTIPTDTITAVSVGSLYACVFKTDGTLVCWEATIALARHLSPALAQLS